MLSTVLAYLLIPHELLHIVGYRLVGKKCVYNWGNPYVKPIGSMTRKERLVGLLFPFIVCSGLGFILILVFDITLYIYFYQKASLGIFLLALFFALLSIIIIYNALASIGDLQKAYILVFDKPLPNKLWFSRLLQPRPLSSERKVFIWTIIITCLVLLLTLEKPY